MSKIIIQNLKQLKAISQLMVECLDTKKAIQNKEISFSIDLKEVLSENKFYLSNQNSKNRYILDFILNDEILYSFDCSNKSMTEYSSGKKDNVYKIEDNEESLMLTKKQMKIAKKSFYKILNKQEDKSFKELIIKKPLHALAVFGF